MNMKMFVKEYVRRYLQWHPIHRSSRFAIDQLKILSAQPLVRSLKSTMSYIPLEDAEFQIFSQFGDDGIIQYLVHRTGDRCRKFIEFGVGTYTECNTRFLLQNNNWEGLVFDGNVKYIEYMRREPLYWLHTLTAVVAFLTREKNNGLFEQYHFVGEIGLLSVDVDGNDYWIWQAISVVQAVIVVIEYNSLFGWKRAVTVPYDPTFDRHRAHYSGLYFGVSLKALCILAIEKGYSFVGCNSAGNNAYFVRTDCLGDIPVQTPEQGYRQGKYRDSRDRRGHLNYLSWSEKLAEIAHMPVLDVETSEITSVGSIL